MTTDINARIKYIEWCKSMPDLPFFIQAWYIQLCAPDQWSAVFEENAEGQIIGVFPFSISKRQGFTILDNPPLSPFTNIWINQFPNDSNYSKVSRYRKILNALIEKLPQTILQKFRFHPSFKDWVPFHQTGYQQRTRYTYELDLSQGTDSIWKNMARRVRQEAGNENLYIDFKKDSSLLYTLMEQSFKKQYNSVPVSSAYIDSLMQTVPDHIQDVQLTVMNEKGVPELSQYVVISNDIAYTLFSGTVTQTSQKSLKSFMLWNLVKKLQPSCNSINFCGSMIPEVERRYRHFGAEQVPYSIIYKGKYPPITYVAGTRF